MIALIAGCGALNDLRSDVTSPMSSLGVDFPPSPLVEGLPLGPAPDVAVMLELSTFSTVCELPLPPPALSPAGVVPEVTVVDDVVVVLSSSEACLFQLPCPCLVAVVVLALLGVFAFALCLLRRLCLVTCRTFMLAMTQR